MKKSEKQIRKSLGIQPKHVESKLSPTSSSKITVEVKNVDEILCWRKYNTISCGVSVINIQKNHSYNSPTYGNIRKGTSPSNTTDVDYFSLGWTTIQLVMHRITPDSHYSHTPDVKNICRA